MVAVWAWLNPPPLLAMGLEQITQLGAEGIAAPTRGDSGLSVESQLNQFCNRLRGTGNLVSKPIMTVSIPASPTGYEWQNAFDAAFNRSKIEILKYRSNEITGSNQNNLQSTTTDGQTEMNSLAMQESASRAAASLVGLTVVGSFSGMSETRELSLGLCVISNRDLQEMVEKLTKAPTEIKLNPSSTSLIDQIETQSPMHLSKQFGSRLLSDPAGHPMIMSFGQAAVLYKGTNDMIRGKFRETSASRAEAIADQQIADYLAGQGLYSDQLLTSQLVEISTDDSSESQKTESMQKLASELSSRVKINLNGVSTVRKWVVPASKTSPEMVGIVRLWQPSE